MRTISITTKDITSSNNNQFKYDFPSDVNLTQKEIGLASLSMFYSMFNVSVEKNNNSVQYVFKGVTYTITFPNMIAEVSDLQAYMFYVFRANGHYLNHTDGTILYPIEMFIDPAQYAVVVVCNRFPAAFTTDYQANVNTHIALTGSTFYPRLLMVTNTNFHKLIGFASDYATNVTGLTTASKTDLSTTSPVLNPDANLIVVIDNLIDNPYSNPNGILHSFGINVSPSSQIVERPNQVAFIDILDGAYRNITLRILNADTLQDIAIEDPEISIMLLIKDKK